MNNEKQFIKTNKFDILCNVNINHLEIKTWVLKYDINMYLLFDHNLVYSFKYNMYSRKESVSLWWGKIPLNSI